MQHPTQFQFSVAGNSGSETALSGVYALSVSACSKDANRTDIHLQNLQMSLMLVKELWEQIL
jgi:hypothetical protein